jgi:hypothetical protein
MILEAELLVLDETSANFDPGNANLFEAIINMIQG